MGTNIIRKLMEIQLHFLAIDDTYDQGQETQREDILAPLTHAKNLLMKNSILLEREEILASISGGILKMWYAVREGDAPGTAYGTEREAQGYIWGFATCFYDEYFIGRCDGSRATLQHDFESFSLGCWAAYRQIRSEQRT